MRTRGAWKRIWLGRQARRGRKILLLVVTWVTWVVLAEVMLAEVMPAEVVMPVVVVVVMSVVVIQPAPAQTIKALQQLKKRPNHLETRLTMTTANIDVEY